MFYSRGLAVRAALALALAAALLAPRTSSAGEEPPVEEPPPDIIFLLLDDMNADMLAHMDRFQSEIADQGTTFENFFTSTPMCCPSRSNFLLGDYSHGHGVWEVRNGPHGGWHAFKWSGLEESVVAKPLFQDLGYRTALMGKYFNWYPNDGDPDDSSQPGGWNPKYVPPHWYSWRGMRSTEMFSYFGSIFNNCDGCEPGDNGVTEVDNTPSSVYSTDYLRDEAVEFIQNNNGIPLFLWIAPVAPHQQGGGLYPVSPSRYDTEYPTVTWPEKPNLFEYGTNKATWMNALGPLDPVTVRPKMDDYFRHALRSLKAVEDLLFGEGLNKGVLQALDDAGRLDNAYIFVASDNGYHFGEHHLKDGKRTFFEEDVRIPLLVRGPGVPAGRTLEHLVGNVDLARTFIELAGGNAPLAMDGRSLVPLLREAAAPPHRWRQAMLLERQESAGVMPEDSYAVRTGTHKYIRYEPTSEEQLYDLTTDPYENESLHTDPGQVDRIAALDAALTELKTCNGPACRSWDGRDPEDDSRKVAGAIFNPCITTGGSCATTIAWDARSFANPYLWIVNDFGTPWRCQSSVGSWGHADAGPWPWGGDVELHVYDSTVPCGPGNSPLPSEKVQTLVIPKAVEPTVLPTAQILVLPSPCVPDLSGQCQVSIFVKSAGIDTGDFDRIEVRTPSGALWRQVTPNTVYADLAGPWNATVNGREMSIYPGEAGTSVCPGSCDVTDPASNLGPRLDYGHMYRE